MWSATSTGVGSTVGVRGISVNGTGVIGNSATATGVFGGGASVGVAGDGVTGVSGSGVALRHRGDPRRERGAATSRPPATPAQRRVAPRSRVDAHQAGELDVDAGGDLWYCVTAGTPGVWRKVAGPSSAGAFHALVPARALRLTDACPRPVAPLATGQARLVNVAARRDVTTGAGVQDDYVPAGATAIACNVTVVDTVGAGFLTINPGGVTAINAAQR